MLPRIWNLLAGAPLAAAAAFGVSPQEPPPAPTVQVNSAPDQAPVRIDVLNGELAHQIHGILRDASTAGFGGAIVVELDGEVVLQGGYGYADREKRIPFGAETVHAIGSITKPFTALAVLDLAQQGKLDLHAPVARYLPGAAEPGASLTPHQLMTHTSGMAEYCGDDDDVVTKDQLLNRCMAMPLVNPPGENWSYSNPGYSVLAAVVEEVSQHSYDEYLKRRFLIPLGLDRTGNTLPRFSYAEIAKQYLDGRLVPPTPGRSVDGKHWQVAGNGGMQSSAIDMYHWYLAIKGDLSLDPALAQIMLVPREERMKKVAATYGFVLVQNEAGEPIYIGHDGSNGIFLASWFWRPKDRAFMYFIGNNGEDEVVQVLRKVRSLVSNRKPI